MIKTLQFIVLLCSTIIFSQTLNPTVSIKDPSTADTFKGGYTFAYATSGTPWNGSLLSFGGHNNNYDTQINANYSSSNISFRTRNGDNNKGWNEWKELATKGSNNFVGNQLIDGKLGIGVNPINDNLVISGGHASTSFLMNAINSTNPQANLTMWASEPGTTYTGVGIGNNIRNYYNNIPFNRILNDKGGSYIRLLENELKFNVVSSIGTNKEMLILNDSGGMIYGNVRSVNGSLMSSKSSNEGGTLDLINISKTGSLAKQWTIYNMTGQYGNGLQFWSYAADGSKSGVKLNITDDGNMALYGKLEAKEIKVTTTPTADFVFEESYNLPKLEDVEKYIKDKKHLPEIASAKEMEENGVNVGEFQIKLLQKIEELTLYLIEQNKLNNEQTELIRKQQQEINQLKILIN